MVLGANAGVVNYVDQLQNRIAKLKQELIGLDKQIQQDSIKGEEYVKERLRLAASIEGLEDEIRRHGG